MENPIWPAKIRRRFPNTEYWIPNRDRENPSHTISIALA